MSEARGGETLQPGQVLIAPGNFHVELHREGLEVKTVLQQQPPENSCRPAVDVLFRSAADVFGKNCLGLVLTGMGQDGMRGSERIVDVQGTVLAQDEASSVVWGMPGFVARAGLAEKVIPLSEIGGEITRRVMVGRAGAAMATMRGEEGMHAQHIA